MLLLLLISYYSISLNAFESVSSIEIYIADDTNAKSETPNVLSTLWFDSAIYQATIITPKRATLYKTVPDLIHQSDCESTSDTRIMIENDDSDSVIIDWVKFTTDSGVWYGINAHCSTQQDISYYENNPSYSHWMIDEPQCDTGKAEKFICIESIGACSPYTQIFHFDAAKLNQFATSSVRESGVNVITKVTTCQPTNLPTEISEMSTTNIPTNVPTNIPTNVPKKIPTNNPTNIPTFAPTFIPTMHPTTIPTQATEAIVSLSCDQDTIGLYNGKQIQFHITMTFLGQMTFDTRASNFDVSTIEVYDAFNALIVYMGQDDDGSISFIADVGTYTIVMESDSDISGIYHVTITCAHINDEIFSTTDSEHKQTTTQYVLLGIDITAQHAKYILIYSALSLLLFWCFVCTLCCLCQSLCKKKKKKEPPNDVEMINHILSAPNDTDHDTDAIDIIPFAPNCTAVNPAMDDYDKMTYDAYIAMLVQWLKEKVYLPQYAPLFIRNGYDSLEIIAQIKSRKELKSIGIHDKAHQVLLMNQIAKLKADMKFEGENNTYISEEEGRIENESSLPQVILGTNYHANYYARCDNCYLKASGKRNDGKFYCHQCYEKGLNRSRIDVCSECRNTKIGRDDQDYGKFFCNQCWEIYEDAVVNDVESETILLYDNN